MHKSSLKETLVHSYQDAEHAVEKVLHDAWHIRLHKKAKHHIHKLRKRPDHHKDIISFFFAFIVTLCVFIGWYYISLPRIIDSYRVIKKQNAALHSSTNPFTEIKERLEGGSNADTIAAPDNSQNNIETQ